MNRAARPGRTATRAHCAGFTLLEVVVTLVIVSMLVATLMQALGHALDLRTRMLRVEAETRSDLLQEAWFRDTTGSVQVDLDAATGGMEGDAGSLAYATPMPLVAAGMSRVRWWLQPEGAGVSLHYSDAGVRDMVVVRGPLRDASFAYLDHAGRWHDAWKPEPEAGERLPRLVRFEAKTVKGRLYWLVPLLAEPIPPDQMQPDKMLRNAI